MIVIIEQKTQYGKQGTTGVNLLPELDEAPVQAYAHSVQDALDWLKKFPLFQDAIIDDLADGRFLVSSQWMPYKNEFAALIDPDYLIDAEFTRQFIVIAPVNTIYENTGFEGFKAE